MTIWLHPKRSGLFALDGAWMTYRGEEIVLLALFDVETLDVVSWSVARDETEESYAELIRGVLDEIQGPAKGFFCDGDPGLLKALRTFFPGIPIQLCIFHKYARAGQIIPFVHTKTPMDREIKRRVETVLFASSKKEAIDCLTDLQRYAREHHDSEKLRKIIGVLKRNFDLLLTHFDYPDITTVRLKNPTT